MIHDEPAERIGEFLENVPEELKRMAQWVNWAGIWSEGKAKFGKAPMNASNGRNASSTDPKTWTTFEKSVAALGRGGVYTDHTGKQHNVTLDGIGFAGLGRTGYTGVDLDHCINTETGEINPAAKRIIEDLDSYTEITPSGCGVRIWVEAEKPPGSWSANMRGETEIEVYTTGRFFTVTGRHMEGTPRTIEKRQGALDTLMERHAPTQGPDTPKPPKAEYKGNGERRLELTGWLNEHGASILKQINDANSERAYNIVCPWVGEHTGGDTSGTRVGQRHNGALWFHCDHGHCGGRKWEHFRELLDPEANRRVNMTIGGKSNPANPAYALTDMGNGERFADQHRNRARYCHPFGRWFIHDGQRFAADEVGGIGKLAKDTVRGMYAEASAIEDEERRKRLVTHARASEARGRVDAMLHMAQSEDGIPVSPQDLDRDPWLLNVRNGTIDLRTGELRPHDPDDLITKLAPVEHDPTAPRDDFEAFLKQILPSEPLRDFVKRLFGYYLTADVSEQILAFAYGTGANGKSTLLNVVLEMMGDYAKQAAPELLTVKQGTSHPTELADLMGRRFVPTIEVEDGKRLAESLVKQLTGSDWISARYMRQDFFQFKPTHKVVLAANHKPIVRGTDFAIWRRIKVIPFDVTIPPEAQDRSLPDKLRAELPGILAWAVEGCLEWQKHGLGEPEEVRAASEDYRTEMDVLAAFIDARCVVAKNASAKASKLYEAYRIWADEAGEYAESQRRFGLRLAERGFAKEKVGVVFWHGIGLRCGDDPGGGDEETVPQGEGVDLVDLRGPSLDLTDAKGPREENPANGHVSDERSGPSGPYGPNLGVKEGFLGHAGFTREIGPQGPQGPRRSTDTPPQRPEPLTTEQVAKYQRLTSQGMKPEIAIAEVRGVKP